MKQAPVQLYKPLPPQATRGCTLKRFIVFCRESECEHYKGGKHYCGWDGAQGIIVEVDDGPG